MVYQESPSIASLVELLKDQQIQEIASESPSNPEVK